MFPDRIMFYTVRRPGEVAWCSTKFRSLKRALAEARNADRVCCQGHKVYATHESGNTTGPYTEE